MDDDFSKYLTAASKKLADAQKSTLKNTNIRDEISCLGMYIVAKLQILKHVNTLHSFLFLFYLVSL